MTSKVIEGHLKSLLFFKLQLILDISFIKNNLILLKISMHDNIIKMHIFLDIKFDLKLNFIEGHFYV